jgi:hypothetical protein
VLNGSVRARLTSSVESGEPARGLPGSRTISSTAGVARTSVVAANPASGLIVEVVIRGRARTVILRAHAPTIGPFCSDACSMFARTSRYAPAARGIRRPPRVQATAQNGRSRQGSAACIHHPNFRAASAMRSTSSSSSCEKSRGASNSGRLTAAVNGPGSVVPFFREQHVNQLREPLKEVYLICVTSPYRFGEC